MNSKRRLLLFIVAWFAFPASILGTVSWSPAQVELSVTPGTLQVVHVRFSSDIELDNARVWIVPELARYIKSDVTAFSEVHAGVENQVTFFISLPRWFTGAELEGAIHIRSSKHSRISRPLHVEIMPTPPAQTVEAAPPTVALPSSDRLAVDPQLTTVEAFARDEIDVLFDPSADNSTIDAVAREIHGAFLGSVPALRYFQILVSPTDLNGLFSLINLVGQNSAVLSANLHAIYKPAAFPADPGTDLSYAPALISLPQAWDITTGVRTLPDGSQLKIGVIDSVFDYSHPDLAANIAYHTQNNAPLSSSPHGTRTSSIVGAVANNDIGIAGVMWNSSMYLYSAGTFTGGLDEALLVLYISQAINDQVRVVNWSIAADCTVCSLTELLQIAQERQKLSQLFGVAGKDVLWVMAAGNAGAPLAQSESEIANNLSNVMAIPAVDSSRAHATFSDYGVRLVAAPGVEIYSDVPGGSFNNGTVNILGVVFDQCFVPPFEPCASGTSFAAPQVVGVAGLMLSVNPSLTPAQIKSIIHDTADPTGNFDPAGNAVLIVNAFQAVQQAQNHLRMDDNFNDNFLDPNVWTKLSPPPTSTVSVNEINQQLQVTMSSGAGGGGVVSTCSLGGDFDVQVDYILLNWPLHNDHSNRLGAYDLGGVGVLRFSDSTSELYELGPGSTAHIATTDTSGQFRLVRTGSTISGYFRSGSSSPWTFLGSETVPTSPTRINLDLGSNGMFAPGGVSVTFDNFTVNSGAISCPGVQ